jgi:hypothetical protein
LIVQPPESALDQSGQLIRSAVNGLVQGRSLVSDRDRLVAFEADFHRTTHVIAALLFAVLITQVDLHSRDVIADSAQSTLDYVTDLSGQRLVTFNITVGVDLDLHGVLFISVVGSIPVGDSQSRPLSHPLGRNHQDPIAQLFDQLAQIVE